ncbi:MAG: hypothetical protein WKF75_00420 [Singulisphaera sp.]
MARLPPFRPDVLDTLGGLTLTVEVRPRNLWRLRLAARLVLRCPARLDVESPHPGSGT